MSLMHSGLWTSDVSNVRGQNREFLPQEVAILDKVVNALCIRQGSLLCVHVFKGPVKPSKKEKGLKD